MTVRAFLLLGVLAGMALLAGCSLLERRQAIEVPKEVRVQVPVACIEPARRPPRPALRSDGDLMAMDEYRRTLAAWSELEKLWAYVPLLEALVDGCSRIPAAVEPGPWAKPPP